MSEPVGARRPRRRRGTREETEQELFRAVLNLLERDGVLSGFTLREVAKEAGVNHGQIYQYFGTRRALLRAAISYLVERRRPEPESYWGQPFPERRLAMWRLALDNPELIRLESLLALDGDDELRMFPELARTRAALDRDCDTGVLPSDADGEVMHALTAATYLGYCVFREAFARDLGIPVDELDGRAAAVYERMVSGLAADEGTASGD
ncbi:TetR/AcrR family transcriptional regulator [Nocardia sp. CDC160]|uniref:TetR/AcrR family transcriptional regulator n=1 Tax=Nocardia sp. CDC160 TaxID=3112166 RepID=UPI002DB6AD4E|nr:TetR/AcrR family transcriptional regulator [Nocardia sp. CDC160]MEC3916898.1 TetR/AcrR family transcriptional regulator [Nocardia sp. CDC160]